MKVCTKCKVEKEFIYFYKNKSKKNGYQSKCKECEKEYRINNKEYNKKYYLDNKEYIIKKSKKYYIDNKECIKLNKKQYRLNNKENIKEQNKKYTSKNKNKISYYFKNRKLVDPLFKLRCNISTLIRISIKGNSYTKKSKTYKILGCSFEEFKTHLENQFTEGMTWENQGLWHLDHIYPVSRATDEEHLIKLNHYTNFQPLWAIDNFKKGNKI
jgi:hypothetical protein